MSYTERKIKITPKSVALIKENLLNDIAEILFLNGEVSTKFIFAIEYDESRWYRFEKSILNPESTRIQGVLRVTGSTPMSGDFLHYTEYYTTTFLSTYNHRDELEVIFREFQSYESTDGKIGVSNIDGTKYTIIKNIDGAIMPNKADAMDGSAEDKAYYYLSDNWKYSSYILNSDDVVVTIDGNPIEYLSLIHDVNKEALPSSSRTSVGKTLEASPLAINSFTLILPLLSTNLAHIALFRDARDKSLINKTYEVKLEIDEEVILEETMELKYSSFTDKKTNPLIFSLMFTTAGNSQRIQIRRANDSVYTDVQLTEFRMEKSITGPQDPLILEDTVVKTIPSVVSRSIYLLIPLNTNRLPEEITSDLELALYSDEVELLYDIKISKHNNSFEYKMLLSNVVMHYADNADEFLSLTFTDRRDL